jgi:hypothetical protein
MKHSFLNQPGPVVTGIIAGQTPEELIKGSQGSEQDGAGGIAIDLSDLKPEFRNTESFNNIVNSADLPFMLTNGKNQAMTNGRSFCLPRPMPGRP